ncbi:MAG: hypothetical protein ACTS53_01320 [Candidatus Hodgkinia cicadicola]
MKAFRVKPSAPAEFTGAMSCETTTELIRRFAWSPSPGSFET